MPTMRAMRAVQTREQILTVARRMFAEMGYAAASTGDIARVAGVGTRGALYHHFADKPALFAAVFEEALRELTIRHVDTVVGTPATGMERLRQMIDSFLDSSLDPVMRQIVLIDGPAVLGWERFREIGAAYGLGNIRDLIDEGVRDGSVRPVAADALAHLLLVSCEEAALYIGNADNPAAAKTDVVSAMDALLDGVRAE